MTTDLIRWETFTENSKYGVRRCATGEIIIPPKYDDIADFHLLDDGEGYLNFPAYFDSMFAEGLCAVVLNDKWGYVDTKGKEIIPLIYSDAGVFSDGLAAVKIDEKYGYINSAGVVVIPLQYGYASYFEGGVAIIATQNIIHPHKDIMGVIDKSGNEVIPAIYDWIHRLFDGTFLVKKDEVFNILDSKGNSLYDSVEESSWFAIYRVEKNGKFGYIFEEEETRTPLIYDEADEYFFCDLASVKRDGKYGYINTKGEEVIQPIYDSAHLFDDECNLAQVEINNKYGFIDVEGKVIIPLIYKIWEIDDFENGLLKVEPNEGESYYLDTNGNRVEEGANGTESVIEKNLQEEAQVD
jgi:hypothetical protein